MPRITLAIDPGVSTGIVLFEGADLVLALTDVDPYPMTTKLCDIYGDTFDRQRVGVVCELGPERGHQPEATKAVERLVTDHAPNAQWVRPSQWKGHPSNVGVHDHIMRLNTKHERDAAMIALWHISTHRRMFDAPV